MPVGEARVGRHVPCGRASVVVQRVSLAGAEGPVPTLSSIETEASMCMLRFPTTGDEEAPWPSARGTHRDSVGYQPESSGHGPGHRAFFCLNNTGKHERVVPCANGTASVGLVVDAAGYASRSDSSTLPLGPVGDPRRPDALRLMPASTTASRAVRVEHPVARARPRRRQLWAFRAWVDGVAWARRLAAFGRSRVGSGDSSKTLHAPFWHELICLLQLSHAT